MNHLKKITKIIVNVFTCILLFILGLIIYGKLVITFGKTSYPNYFGYTFFEIASGSMKPTLQINDVILVKITKENLKKGDIIAFHSDNAIITHRILYIDGNIITVKGDSNNVVDKPITKEQVIGKEIKIYHKLGIWKKVFSEPKIIIALFITLLLFDFALSYNGKRVYQVKSKKKDFLKPNQVAKQINDKELLKEKQEKKIEDEKLLDFTRTIDIDEINRLLEGTDYKLEKKEINNLKSKLAKVNDRDNKSEDVVNNLSKKEKKVLEYTMRLDLNEIQKRIDNKIK